MSEIRPHACHCQNEFCNAENSIKLIYAERDHWKSVAAKLKEALELYADENNWGRSDDGWVDWNSDDSVPYPKGDSYRGGASIAQAAIALYNASRGEEVEKGK